MGIHRAGRDRSDSRAGDAAVFRGLREVERRGPVRGDALAAALRLGDFDTRLEPVARARMRQQVLGAISPVRMTPADHVMTVLSILAQPAPALLRLLAVGLAAVGLLAGATVASADSLPDEALYGFKLAGEQLRLGIASTPMDRAAVGISIAAHRLGEAERLAAAGRDDATIGVTSAYGLSLANAAAELASVERLKPKWGALVLQLEAQLGRQQDRIAIIAGHLAGDPRTAGAAAVLDTIGTRAGMEVVASAVRIAEDAAAVTTRLAGIAADRAVRGSPMPLHPVAPVGQAVGAPGAARVGTPESRSAGGPGVAALQPSTDPADAPADRDEAVPEGGSVPARLAKATVRPAAIGGTTPPPGARPANRAITGPPALVDVAAAREAARGAERAAEQAARAALRARENSHSAASPDDND